MDREKMMLAIGVGETEYPEFDIPESMDVTELRDGDEREIVAKVRRKGDKLCLIEVNGIALGGDDGDDQEEEWSEEENYENEAEDVAMTASETDDVSARARSVGLI